MATRRRKQRMRILVACEGASERGYGRWLQSILDSQDYYVHIESWLPGRGGGDYLSLVEESIAYIDREKRRDRPYKIMAILLDTTQKGDNPTRDNKAEMLARGKGIFVIWQDPDHEAFLLRHLPGCETLKPPVGRTMAKLLENVPTYKKGMPATELNRILNADCLKRAYGAETAFAAFLNEIGYTG